MADRTMPRMVPPVAAPQHHTPPTMRELRAQAVHRLQIGLAGLAAMLLLVGLANIIMERAQESEMAGAPVTEAAKKTSEVGDPLAEIGAAPAASSSTSDAAPK